jgi:N-acylneuraminate cytidylyltransferase
VLSLVQATSPLTLAEDFRAARRRFEAGNHDSLLTAVPLNRFLWSKDGTPINYDPRARPRRQDFDGGVMLENGAFYITRAAMLRQTRCRLGGSVAIHPMSQEHLLEVDEPADWDIIEGLLLRRRQRNRRYPDKLILGLVVDVDGTLTDGGMYYGPEGELLKKFDTRDAHGLASVRGHGVRVSVISGERSAAVAARMEKLGIRDYHPGVQDKAACLRQIAAAWKLDMTEIAYVGDDLTDLDCMREAGFSCCPSDATGPVRAAVDYICTRPGGAGAVREVCDLILADTVKTTP